ncbi:hypothetical protein GOBAR_DD20531 [Gossypium barbadense]|nr:hypothetical protein GOBAR_DD20531 [Gossypium barbadense]
MTHGRCLSSGRRSIGTARTYRECDKVIGNNGSRLGGHGGDGKRLIGSRWGVLGTVGSCWLGHGAVGSGTAGLGISWAGTLTTCVAMSLAVVTCWILGRGGSSATTGIIAIALTVTTPSTISGSRRLPTGKVGHGSRIKRLLNSFQL